MRFWWPITDETLPPSRAMAVNDPRRRNPAPGAIGVIAPVRAETMNAITMNLAARARRRYVYPHA